MTHSSILLLAIEWFSFYTVHSTTNGDALSINYQTLILYTDEHPTEKHKNNAPAKFIELPNLTVFLDD